MESFLVYLFNFYYAISELEQNKQNNTIIFFLLFIFLTKKWASAVCGGVRARPSHPPSLRACQGLSESWCIKETGESMTRVDLLVSLMHHDPDRSCITDPDPDHPKGTQPKIPHAADYMKSKAAELVVATISKPLTTPIRIWFNVRHLLGCIRSFLFERWMFLCLHNISSPLYPHDQCLGFDSSRVQWTRVVQS